MTTLGAASLYAVTALATCRVVAMLITLIGFLVTKKSTANEDLGASLFMTLAQTMGIGMTNQARSFHQPDRMRPSRREPRHIDDPEDSETTTEGGPDRPEGG